MEEDQTKGLESEGVGEWQTTFWNDQQEMPITSYKVILCNSQLSRIPRTSWNSCTLQCNETFNRQTIKARRQVSGPMIDSGGHCMESCNLSANVIAVSG